MSRGRKAKPDTANMLSLLLRRDADCAKLFTQFTSDITCQSDQLPERIQAAGMKLLNWVRFTWDLNSLPSTPVELPKHYTISPARKADDEKAIRKVLSCSFLLDPAWNPAIAEVMHSLQSWLDRAFLTNENTCLALRHGSRIIGASVLCLDPATENHFAPGPCILMEYRNRGFGTQLLHASLMLLRD